jgi:hypothetical protein
MWRLLVDATTQAPWLGYGWLQVGAAQLEVAELHPPAAEFWMHGHNLFLELILWCGYPLGLGLSVLLVYWLAGRARRIVSVEGWLALMAVLVFGVHAMLELPHHYAYFLLPVGLWIGQIELAASPAATQTNRAVRSRLAPALLGAVMMLAIWRDYAAVEEDFRRVRFEFLRIGPAHSGPPAPSAPYLSGLTGFLRFARTEPVAGMSDKQMAEVGAAAKRYPYAPSLYRWARALALNGRLSEARLVLVKMRHMHGEPTYVLYRADIGLAALLRSMPS